MEGEGDDDDDPDGRYGAMVPSETLIQQFLIMFTKKVPSTQDDDFLALIPYTAPPWWRKSETEVAGTRQVDGIGVAGGDNPMLPSHCQTQQFLITEKVPSTQDDDFLAPIPYTAPPWWRKSETEVAGTQQVDGIWVAGRDNPMVPSHCQTQQFLITKKVLSTQDDDFLAPILYSTTMVEEVRNRGGGDSKGGWDRCWRVWLGGGGGGGGWVRNH